jgi:thiamine transport system permease protein
VGGGHALKAPLRTAATGAAVAAVFVPVLAFLVSGFAASPGLREALGAVAPASVARVVGATLLQASFSTLASVALALPASYLLGRIGFPGKRLLRALTLLPFVLPGIVVVVAMIGFFGRRGVVTFLLGGLRVDLYGLTGIVIAHVYYNVAIVIRFVSDAWGRIGNEYRESATIAGAGGRDYFARIVVPLLAPSIAASALYVFIYSALSFAVVLVFGGVTFATVEVRIYQELFTYHDPTAAAYFTLVQLLFTVLFLVASVVIFPRLESSREPLAPAVTPWAKLSRLRRLSVVLIGALFCFFLAGPLVTVAVRAGAGGFSLVFGSGPPGRNLVDVVGRSLVSVATTSVSIALASAAVAFPVAYLAASRRRPAVTAAFPQLPIGVSFVSFALGLRVLFRSADSVMLIIAADLFLSFPIVYRMTATAFADFPREIADAARVDGAGRLAAARYVEIPALAPALAGAFAWAVAVPLADLTGVLTLGRGGIVTFPIAIYRMIGFRNFDGALALASIYVAFVLVLFSCIDFGVSSPAAATSPRRRRR